MTSPLCIDRLSCAGTVCQAFPGYTAVADRNAPGNFIGLTYSSLQAVYEACARDPGCAGFNTYFNMKSSVNETIEDPGTCLYIKTGAWRAGCTERLPHSACADRVLELGVV